MSCTNAESGAGEACRVACHGPLWIMAIKPSMTHWQPACLQGLPNEEYRFVRRTIINIILATDMCDHSRLTKVLPAAIL